MTNKEIVEMLKLLKEQAVKSCNDTAIIDVKKNSFDFVMDSAIKALEQEQQSEWERDHEVLKAYADGQESMKPCKDAISKQSVLNILDDMVKDYVKENDFDKAQGVAWVKVQKLPSVSTEKIGRCKDCKYFDYDNVAKVDGIPLIVAHEICSRWGRGCMTVKNGYCFLYEPKESEV